MNNETLAALIDAEHSDPDDTLQYVRDDHEVWMTGKPLTVVEAITRHDGHISYFETTKRAVQINGKTAMTVGVSRPIQSERAAGPETLRAERKESSAALRSFVAAFPAPVLVVDAKTHIVAVSRDFRELFPNLADPIGRGLETLLNIPKEIELQLLSAMNKTRLEIHDVKIGEKRLFDVRLAPWQLPEGRAVGMMLALNEVTELRASERKLAAERKALQSQHEWRASSETSWTFPR